MPGQCPNVKGRGHRPHADVEAAVEACLNPEISISGRDEAKGKFQSRHGDGQL